MYTNHFSPSRTAVTMAVARAIHQLLDEPIVLKDDNAQLFLDQDTKHKIANNPYAFNDPMARTMRAAVVARNCMVLDALKAAKKSNPRLQQVVILGCGLDTISISQSSIYSDIDFYDVDISEMIEWRKSHIDKQGWMMPTNVHHVACDLTVDDLLESLKCHGFHPEQPVFFAMMGVTPYLNIDSVFNLMELISNLPTGTSIHFDYRVKTHLLNPIEQMMDRVVAEQVAKMGEPWLSDFTPDEFAEKLKAMGFSRVDHFDTERLNELFYPRRKDGLQTTGGGLRLISSFID